MTVLLLLVIICLAVTWHFITAARHAEIRKAHRELQKQISGIPANRRSLRMP